FRRVLFRSAHRRRRKGTMTRSTKETPQRVRMTGDLTSRTGIAAQHHAEEMREGARAFTPRGSENEYRLFRGALLRDGGPIGTLPMPPSLRGAAKQGMAAMTGQRPLVLLDKLAERLAFERTGTRLYESMLMKLDREGSYDGGPTRGELETICAEEREHFETLCGFVEQLGGDPTAVTPSADVAAVASLGLIQVVSDPRIGFAESLEAMLIAELVDYDAWKIVRSLAEEAGRDDLLAFAQRAEDEEDK